MTSDDQVFDLLKAIYGDLAFRFADIDSLVPVSNREFDIRGLMEVLPLLDEFSREVLVARFGLNGEEPKSVSQVANDQGLSVVKVLSVIQDALRTTYTRNMTDEEIAVDDFRRSLTRIQSTILDIHLGKLKEWPREDDQIAQILRITTEDVQKARSDVLARIEQLRLSFVKDR